MKKKITKQKVILSLRPELKTFLIENFENKSNYIEYLIYKDLNSLNLLTEKEKYIKYDNR
jgi:hypothetical protein